MHDYQCLLLLCLLVLKKVLLFSQLLDPVYGDVCQGSPPQPIAGARSRAGGNLGGKIQVLGMEGWCWGLSPSTSGLSRLACPRAASPREHSPILRSASRAGCGENGPNACREPGARCVAPIRHSPRQRKMSGVVGGLLGSQPSKELVPGGSNPINQQPVFAAPLRAPGTGSGAACPHRELCCHPCDKRPAP